MTARTRPIVPTAFFLQGRAGRLFALHIPAVSAREPAREGVLMCPAFAEEMNRSRRQVMLQAQAFAAGGRDVLLLDLFGTGESEGDFADARWELWLDDLERGARWLMQNGAETLCLWGLRLGAMLAHSLALNARQFEVSRLLLWQPVATGKVYLNQLLRLRLAAQMSAGGGGETTASLRQMLASGATIEVAGYALAPALAEALDGLNLKSQGAEATAPVDWVELISPGRELSAASRGTVDALRAGGTPVNTHLVVGEAFWNTPETTTVAALTDTCAAMLDARAA